MWWVPVGVALNVHSNGGILKAATQVFHLRSVPSRLCPGPLAEAGAAAGATPAAYAGGTGSPAGVVGSRDVPAEA